MSALLAPPTSVRQRIHSWFIRSRLRIRSEILRQMHLNSKTQVLSLRNTRILLEFFNLLDCHNVGFLNDIQFLHMMKRITNLSQRHISRLFDLLDTDFSGRIDFDEFYFLMCGLIAHKDMEDKQFLNRHSHIVYQLMDVDGSGSLSDKELSHWGFAFALNKANVARVTRQFRILNSKELWYEDFLFFTEETVNLQSLRRRK